MLSQDQKVNIYRQNYRGEWVQNFNVGVFFFKKWFFWGFGIQRDLYSSSRTKSIFAPIESAYYELSIGEKIISVQEV